MHFNLAIHRAQDHVDISAKLPQDLPASPARRRRRFRVGEDRNGLQDPRTLRDCLQHSHPFSARAQPIRGAFDIAAAECIPGRRPHCRTYAKPRMRSIRILPRRSRGRKQCLLFAGQGH